MKGGQKQFESVSIILQNFFEHGAAGRDNLEAVYRIVIADDEAIVRNGMRDRIDWASHGFDLVGVCENGQEALEAIEQTRPHIVLADIYMPLMNGLDLSAAIAERFPETRVVLLTGYDRIEYAQEAVRKRVSDFLLKPITPQELRDVLDRMKLQLDHDCMERERRQLLEEQLAASVPLLRERTLNSLIRRGGDMTRMEVSMRLCGLNWNYSSYVIALFDKDVGGAGPAGAGQPTSAVPAEWSHHTAGAKQRAGSCQTADAHQWAGSHQTAGAEQSELDLIELGAMVDTLARACGAVEGEACMVRGGPERRTGVAAEGETRRTSGAVEQTTGGAPVARFRTTEGLLALVFACDDAGRCKQEAIGFSEAVVELARKRGRYTVSAGVGLPVCHLRDLPLTYEQSREALSLRYRHGGSVVYDFRDLTAGEEAEEWCDTLPLEETVRLLRSAGLADTLSALDAFVDRLRRGEKNEPTCRTELLRLYLEIVQAASAMGIPGEETDPTSEAFRGILEAATLDAASIPIRRTVEQIHTGLELRRARRCERMVAEAKQYIREHFTDPDLQLSDVIQTVAASTSYFSQVFKNETGQTFVEYLSTVRVEHAKALIRMGMDRIYEIAQASGYRDAHYFSLVFKKYAGMTATQFRKQVEQGEAEVV